MTQIVHKQQYILAALCRSASKEQITLQTSQAADIVLFISTRQIQKQYRSKTDETRHVIKL